MKEIITILIISLMIGCGTGSDSGSSAQAQLKTELFKVGQRNGCIECHSISATVVGPSWNAVAERYKDAPTEETRAMLINSVNKGSKGKYLTWKGGHGMPALEKRVSNEAVEQLVDYILALRH